VWELGPGGGSLGVPVGLGGVLLLLVAPHLLLLLIVVHIHLPQLPTAVPVHACNDAGVKQCLRPHQGGHTIWSFAGAAKGPRVDGRRWFTA
jgi:hypothetical protein